MSDQEGKNMTFVFVSCNTVNTCIEEHMISEVRLIGFLTGA